MFGFFGNAADPPILAQIVAFEQQFLAISRNFIALMHNNQSNHHLFLH